MQTTTLGGSLSASMVWAPKTSRRCFVAAALGLCVLLAGCGTRLSPSEVRGLRGAETGEQALARTASAERDDALLPGSAGSAAADGGTSVRRVPTGPAVGPANCRGGATDVGVTAESVLVGGSVAIRPIPRQFTPAAEAIAAYFKMINASGGVCGRRIEYRSYDDQLNTSAYRDNVVRLVETDKAFALLGGMSAADSGGCGYLDGHRDVPDVGTFALATCRALAGNFYSPMGSVRPDLYGGTPQWAWLLERFPYERPAVIWVNQPVVREQGVAVVDGLVRTLRDKGVSPKAGRDDIVQQEHPIVGANFDLAVVQMREQVDSVWTVMDIDNNRALLAAMCRNNWRPKVVHFEISVYDPLFFEKLNNDQCVDGQNVWMRAGHLPFGHTDNAEINRYARTLKTYFPDSAPATFGLYGWLSAKLFVEVLAQLGPNLTRKRFFETINGVRDWTGGGAIAPNTPAERYVYVCNIMMRVAQRDFVPHSGFLCGPLYKAGDYTGPAIHEQKAG